MPSAPHLPFLASYLLPQTHLFFQITYHLRNSAQMQYFNINIFETCILYLQLYAEHLHESKIVSSCAHCYIPTSALVQSIPLPLLISSVIKIKN